MNRFRIDPLQIKTYLESKNWTSVHYPGTSNILIFSNYNYPRRQLRIPVDMTAPDYDDSIYIAMDKLSDIERKPLDLTLTEIEDLKYDVLRFRITSSDLIQHSIPLSLGHSSLQGAEQSIKSAACSVVQPQIHHPKLNKSESNSLIQNSLMGHTENGSFIIKVSCPLFETVDRSPMLFGEENIPFTRRATTFLATGIHRLTSAIRTNSIESLITEIKSGGVPEISKNLCDSLQYFYDDKVNNNLEIKINWSSMLPQDHQILVDQNLIIENSYFSLIEAIGHELTVDAPPPVETYNGTVEELRGEMGSDGKRSGEVILKLFVDDRIIRCRVVLDEDSYLEAYHAHGDPSAVVRVRGVLQSGRQPRSFESLELFKILN